MLLDQRACPEVETAICCAQLCIVLHGIDQVETSGKGTTSVTILKDQCAVDISEWNFREKLVETIGRVTVRVKVDAVCKI
jgi:hypothetical protein